MTQRTYILDEQGNPVAEPDMKRWSEWFANFSAQSLKRTELAGGVVVSTVFTGRDHNYSDEGPPLLWETITLEDSESSSYTRYATQAEAIAGHDAAVKRAEKAKSSTRLGASGQ